MFSEGAVAHRRADPEPTGWRNDQQVYFPSLLGKDSRGDFGISGLFVVIRSFPPPGCSEASDEIFLMFLMKDDICLPVIEDISSAGMLSNMLHSQHDTKSKNHREKNYWRKITPKDLFPHDEDDSPGPRHLA